MRVQIHLEVIIVLVHIFHLIQPLLTADTNAIYQSCLDHTSLCFGFPEDCVNSAKCQVLFRSQYDQASGYNLQLIGPSVKQDQYIAVGFSNKSVMSGMVVQCFQSSTQPSLSTIQYSFNAYSKRDNQPIDNLSKVAGFSNLKSTYQDGTLQCSWSVSTNQFKVNYEASQYDFEHDKFYIQLATGDVNKNQISYHEDNKISSSSAVSLKSTSAIQAAGTPNAVRWHASLMIFGWMGCITVAILMARFTRDLWPDQKLFGQKIWFVFHRYLMITGWLAIVASHVVIFVHYGGWRKTNHSIVGLVAGILATLQIGNSFLRPAPDSKRRYLFDYIHWMMGNSAHLLAVSNIIGSAMHRSTSFFWLVIAYLFVYLLFSDILRKLENRLRQSYKSTASVAFLLQNAVLISVGIIVSIVISLVVIMFSKG